MTFTPKPHQLEAIERLKRLAALNSFVPKPILCDQCQEPDNSLAFDSELGWICVECAEHFSAEQAMRDREIRE